MTGRRRATRPRAVWFALLAAAAASALGACGWSSTPAPAHAARAAAAPSSGAKPTRAELLAVHDAAASAHWLATAPGMPTCTPPALPAATYPPGAAYGIPFLAAITNGELVTGYDEWTANHHLWKVGKTTYDLYPWQTKVYGITGWVTGLLQLPSLGAVIPPNGIVFCDQGGQACESASPPAGECIRVELHGAPVPGQAPQPPTTNVPAPGEPCFEKSKLCIPYVITLSPSGDSQLDVTGVAANGALMLSVTTSAVTTLNLTLPGVSQTCSDAATDLALSSEEPNGLPAGAPISPNAGNPDDRGLRTAPTPLTGPLGTASTTLGTNDFSVPAFSATSCPALAAVFDAPLAGWNTRSSKDPASENNNYFDKSPPPADAGTPGWVQFSATTTISDLGLPAGPPAGFTLSPPAP
jgi:hypothetical protein